MAVDATPETFASLVGDGVFTVALALQALDLSSRPTALASVLAARAVPRVLFLLIAGAMSDRLGRKNSVVVMAASQGILLFAFIPMAESEWLLYLGATLIGFNFGGNFALFPALTADEFGNDAVGRNYPWVFLSYGAGGIVFPILGGWLGDLGNFPLAFTICGVGCLVGAVATWVVFPPTRAESSKPLSVHGFVHNAHFFDHAERA